VRGPRWLGCGAKLAGEQERGADRAEWRGVAALGRGWAGRGGGFWAGSGGREAARGGVGLGRTGERGGLRVGFCLGPVWLWVCFGFLLFYFYFFSMSHSSSTYLNSKINFEFKPL